LHLGALAGKKMFKKMKEKISPAEAPQYHLPELPQYDLPDLRGRRDRQRCQENNRI